MARQPRARLRLLRKGLLPVERHPVADQRAVERPLLAEHQVDARRLVEELGPVERAAHLRFEPPEQARQEHAVELAAIDQVGGGGELVRLAEPEAAVTLAVVRAEGQRARAVEQRQHGDEIGIRDGIELHAPRGLLELACGLLQARDLGLVGAPGVEPEPAQAEHGEAGHRPGGDRDRAPPGRRAGLGGDEPRSAEHHLAQQPAEEVAPPLPRRLRGGARPAR